MPSKEQILDALKGVKFPGLSRDIVSFGFVHDVSVEGGDVSFTVRFQTENQSAATQIGRDAEAAVKSAQHRLALGSIRAPVSGTLYQFDLKVGAYLQPGDLVGLVGNLDKVKVTVYVDEPDLGRVAVGMPVTITWDAMPGRQWKGTVDKFPTQVVALGTRQVGEVGCIIDNPDRDLLPGEDAPRGGDADMPEGEGEEAPAHASAPAAAAPPPVVPAPAPAPAGAAPVTAAEGVEADRHLLASAISNVLQNAFKFTRHDGRVALRTLVRGNRVLIEVEDECGGLPPGKAEELFQPFSQRIEGAPRLAIPPNLPQRLRQRCAAAEIRDVRLRELFTALRG